MLTINSQKRCFSTLENLSGSAIALCFSLFRLVIHCTMVLMLV
ncbi:MULTISPECIES: hypothetical protein [unclassified Nodularia (in: cyanobacteria)]|nr:MULTISPECIES: hypothetical protein [unclassified Nodularia (in: cyanobacteria)]